MPPTLLTTFSPDPERLATLSTCMEPYGLGDPDAEWPNNIISRKAVVYGSGVIARQGDSVRHAVDPDELTRCQQLATAAAAMMEGISVGMGSESDDPFFPFFIAANYDEPAPERIDAELIRTKFGGTLFPLVTITVEPLEEAGIWWFEVMDYFSDGADEEEEEAASNSDPLRPWRAMISWFQQQAEFKDTAFVRIGDYRALSELDDDDFPAGTEIAGCVLPRLALGLTEQGSLVGLFGWSVQT